MANERRLRKLVDFRLQVFLSLWFVGVGALTTVLSFFAVSAAASRVALELPHDGNQFSESFTAAMIPTMIAVLGISLSLTLVVGIVVTHRVAGPIYRIRRFLEAIERGEQPADCHLRPKDELGDLCVLLNRVTAPLRSRTERPEQREARAA